MDRQERASNGLTAGGLVIVALLAGGAMFVSRPPLESSRPDLKPTQLERREVAQDIDSRLWQDPFDAVAKARESVLKSPEALKVDRQRHHESRLADEIARQRIDAGRGGVVVMAVMLSGGPYADGVESRLRTRYAVLAGLKARSFVPVDNEHLGYYYPKDGEGARYGLPEIVPYEFFDTEPDARDRCGGCRLLVVWLDSSAFHERPLQKLVALAQGLTLPGPQRPTDAAATRWRVLGPLSSDGLRAVIEEADRSGFAEPALQDFDLRLFSAAATTPDAALLKGTTAAAGVSVSTFLESRGVKLLRTIGTDDKLARALVNELELRGLRTRPPNGRKVSCPDADRNSDAKPQALPSSIAIVSEGDTLYGRSLRQQFRYDAASDRPGFCVTRWHYFRGLDGRLPGDATSQRTNATGATSAKKDPKAEAIEAIGRDRAYLERPEGTSQLDYLRRLAMRIRDEDAALRKHHGPQYGIRAIGVLGNDVYDKLLVLQALQAQLPHAIFFTTDMDARLFHPREQDWARNLIVASSFGLRLDDALQRDLAPFRDGYQSSAYLATLLLLADVGEAITPMPTHTGSRLPTQSQISAWFEKPRLFEVTRSGAFDFSEPVTTAAPLAAAAQDRSLRCSRRLLGACGDVHPERSAMFPHTNFAARFLVFAALILLVSVPTLALSRNGKRRLRRFVAAGQPGACTRKSRVAALLAVLGLLVIVLPLLLAAAWPMLAEEMTRDGKPLSFTDGISPWPTYALRLATLLLCVALTVRAWTALSSNADRITHEFRLSAVRRRLGGEIDADDAGPQWWHLLSLLSTRVPHERVRPLGTAPDDLTPTAEIFWKHYLLQDRIAARLLRTAVATVLMVLLGQLAAHAIGDAPIAPHRGELTMTMQNWSTRPAGVAALFLVLFVVDAIALCVCFVHGLRRQSANWPTRTLKAFAERTGMPASYLGEWIDLEFVARRTRCVGALVYYPFIVLSLLLLARSSFFDDWYTPPSTAVLATLSFAIVLGCAFALRRAAEASRRHALAQMQDAVLRAKAQGGVLVDQLETLSTRMRDLREGAFAPYSQQPLLKAVLLPLMTVGGSSLFDYLALANL